MNILILTKKLPFPVRDGESIAIMNLARNLTLQKNAVTMLCVQTPKHHFAIENFPREIKNMIHFESVFVDTSTTLKGIAKNVFSILPYHIQRFFSPAYSQKLSILLTEKVFDIVQLEGLFLVPYIPLIREKSKAKIVFRSHNIEGNIWKLLAGHEKNIAKKLFYKWQSKKLLLYEKRMLPMYDAVIPISLSDEMVYNGYKHDIKIKYIPSGVDVKELAVQEIQISTLYYFGALDWLPNIEGLRWFIEKIFPLVLRNKPATIFHIAGRNAGQYFKNLTNKNIIFHGEVENADDFLKDKSICIVPLLSGSGMKIKILEALAQAKFVITTSVGIEGYPAEVEKYCVISDDENEFANDVLYALENSATVTGTALAGQQFVKNNFDNVKLVAELIQFYSTL